MKRRIVLAAAWLAMGSGGRAAFAQAPGQPAYKVSAEQLRQAISQRFPLRYTAEGLVNFDVQPPLLRLLPERNRIAGEMVVQVAGPALRRSYTGLLDIDFALRYEPTDQSLRAHQLQVHSLHIDGLPQRAGEVIEAYAPKLAEQSLHEVILHRLRPQDLALADAMGLQPAEITVTSQGLVIGFEPKQVR